jgi:hypothetical protein
MQDKQKVTLYLPQETHRQLKIHAAVASETMTEIAQKAIEFYLSYPEVVDRQEQLCGLVHQVYSCPDCSTSLVIRDGELRSVGEQSSSSVVDESLSIGAVAVGSVAAPPQGEEQLVPC